MAFLLPAVKPARSRRPCRFAGVGWGRSARPTRHGFHPRLVTFKPFGLAKQLLHLQWGNEDVACNVSTGASITVAVLPLSTFSSQLFLPLPDIFIQFLEMKNSCLVLEGGGLRGAFTSGVLEYLLEQEICFDRVIGVSAGACVGASYVSGQKGRNKLVNVEYPSDKRYMGWKYLFTTGSYFNMKFVFGELPVKLVPFDETAFYANSTEFEAITTSCDTGEAVAFGKEAMATMGIDHVLVASSSIPLLSQPAPVGEKLYFDGGVSDSIPVLHALQRSEKAVVVLTRPRGYRKGRIGNKLLLKLVFRKYPAFLKTLLARNESYNKTLELCEQLELEGKLFLIVPSPEFSIGRTEKSLQKRMALYDHGYALMAEKRGELERFLVNEK